MATDEELISHLIRGDEFALKALYDRHGKNLYALALRITGDAASAEELLQDTFFQLWQKASQFDAARGSLAGWLLTMVRHRAISHIRQKRNQPSSYSPIDDVSAKSPSGSVVLEQEIARQLISAALARLPKAQREAVTLAYFDGLTHDEIAIRTGTALGTVKGRLRSGLTRMSLALSKKNPLSTKRIPARRAITLRDILITDQLLRRPSPPRQLEQEAECLRALWRAASASSDQLINSFLQMATELCGAGSVGISLLETEAGGEQIFRWTHLGGKLAEYVGGSTPRNFSPCGTTLDRCSPQLFSYPERYFQHLGRVGPLFEVLVIPFHAGKETNGTIWIASHEERTSFNAEDARIMTSLAEFAGCALHLKNSSLSLASDRPASISSLSA